MFKKKTLQSGLRGVVIPKRGLEGATVMVLARAGSRYEKKEENGIAHFLEHLFMRGTETRPDQFEVFRFLDRIGAEVNALTYKGRVNYFVRLRKKHLGQGLDWLSDVLLSPLLREEDMEKERGVILEERNMYLDTPRRFVWDVWERLLYGEHPLGRLIIGSEENVRGFGRSDFLSYLGRNYRAENMVVAVAGDVEPESVFRRLEEFFGQAGSGNRASPGGFEAGQEKPGLRVRRKETDQNHLCLGVRGFGLEEKERYAQKLITLVLGGMKSSRFFSSIRSKRGLAYYIQSRSQSFLDRGYLTTACGTGEEKTERVVRLILGEYRKVREEGLREEELERAKEKLKGRLALRLESSNALASFYGKQELLREKMLTPDQFFERINRVGPSDIREAAEEIFTLERLNLALIGEADEDTLYKELKSF